MAQTAAKTAKGSAGIRNTDPPLWVAWNQALASIRVRFFRQFVTSVGIALGIAFFASVMTMRAAQMATSAANAADESRMHWLLGTSLVMCLVGVTNSMLMSVAERYREIGTIKCLGASDGFIVRVFFIEALLLGAAGSFMGAVVGTAPVALLSGVPFGAAAGSVLLATVVGMTMTVAAAVVPAIQAAKMPAAAALRVDV